MGRTSTVRFPLQICVMTKETDEELLCLTDYYGDTFFKSAGTTLSPYVIQTILGAVSVVGTAPALYLIETVGRRDVCTLLLLFAIDHPSNLCVCE